MIQLDNVTDHAHLFGRHQLILQGASLALPVGRFALLSKTPELHTALIDVIAGLRPPRYGAVHHTGLVSWPIGRMGFVRGKLTGLKTTSFVCDLYGLDFGVCLDLLDGILTSPEYLTHRIMDWPTYVRQEYIFALSLAPDFDVFVVDNMMPPAQSRFGRLWGTLFDERLVGRSLIVATNNQQQIMDYCTKALIYEDRTFRIDDDLESCIKRYPLKPFSSDRASELDGTDGDDSRDADDAGGDLFI